MELGATAKLVQFANCTGVFVTVFLVTQGSLWDLGALSLYVLVSNSNSVDSAFLSFSIQPSQTSYSSLWLDRGWWLFPFPFCLSTVLSTFQKLPRNGSHQFVIACFMLCHVLCWKMRTGSRALRIMLLMSVQCSDGCYSNFLEVSFVYLYFLLKRIYLFLFYVYKFFVGLCLWCHAHA